MSDYAFEEGEAYLGKYNIKESRKKDGGRGGNFVVRSNGEIASSRPITKHAHQRIKERGCSMIAAMKGTKKSGAIISDNGKVITVIPEGWKKNAGAIQLQNNDASRKQLRPSRIPDEKNLPKGSCLSTLTIPSNVIAIVLGKEHSNIQSKIKQLGLGLRYEFNENTITIWGSEEYKVKRLMEYVDTCVSNSHRDTGPPIPKGQFPSGQTKRCIFVAECNIGRVLGKAKHNLKKMRADHSPAASINFNCKNGEMNVWGETAQVNKVCDEVASIVVLAKDMRKKHASFNKKMGDKKVSQKVRGANNGGKDNVNLDWIKKLRKERKLKKKKQSR